KMTFHISGCLLDYLGEKHPKTIGIIKEMVSRNQIEMMGGGYYEPILPSLPERDLKGQINMMSDYIKNRFGAKPQGMWIPERVWQPELTKPINESGIKYSILDDTHFLRAGLKKEDLHGYFLTGKGTKKIAIFPSDKTLRYTMPFKLHHETIDYFKNESRYRENLLFTYGDDGEKFGEWPGTHKWVFEEKWLKGFFEVLLQNRDWINLIKLSDYYKNNEAIGTIEIPQGSYEEMMEWSGGSWMNFLNKYPETNQMHKKMVYVSEKIAVLQKKATKSDSAKLKEATKELYKGQCNCGYWHGVFGGLYLFHLRNAIYNHLITADKIADEILHKKDNHWLNIKEVDFNLDGKKKIIVENKTFSLNLDTHGGVLKELDYRPLSLNLINTLSRKEEVYHKKILESMGEKHDEGIKTIHDDFREVKPILKKKIIYDKFPRYCLRTFFLKEDLNMEEFIHSAYAELGDFSSAEYKIAKKKDTVVLERTSEVLGSKLKLAKQIKIKSEKELEFIISVDIFGSIAQNIALGLEFNITMPSLNSDRYNYFSDNKNLSGLGTSGSVFGLSNFGVSDSGKEIGLKFKFDNQPDSLWYFPIETVSQSERAYELNYQCSCIFTRWKITPLAPRSWDTKINLQFT
ncbi:MAG TPA: DUF1926 domain-containing protein, partial [Candidatus Omnitrophota bacterium]|nr:DUF1926 domain-containing protein [Candidatus Omnitrophota bacterium]